jgi:hypothetical protein
MTMLLTAALFIFSTSSFAGVSKKYVEPIAG